MISIPLSKDALRGAKRTVVEAYPELKSAHLSEGLAAGLGFRSHAAMLAQSREADRAECSHAVFNSASFEQRMSELTGKPWPYGPERSLNVDDFQKIGGIQAPTAMPLGSITDDFGHIFRTGFGEVDIEDFPHNRRILVVLLPEL